MNCENWYILPWKVNVRANLTTFRNENEDFFFLLILKLIMLNYLHFLWSLITEQLLLKNLEKLTFLTRKGKWVDEKHVHAKLGDKVSCWQILASCSRKSSLELIWPSHAAGRMHSTRTGGTGNHCTESRDSRDGKFPLHRWSHSLQRSHSVYRYVDFVFFFIPMEDLGGFYFSLRNVIWGRWLWRGCLQELRTSHSAGEPFFFVCFFCSSQLSQIWMYSSSLSVS